MAPPTRATDRNWLCHWFETAQLYNQRHPRKTWSVHDLLLGSPAEPLEDVLLRLCAAKEGSSVGHLWTDPASILFDPSSEPLVLRALQYLQPTCTFVYDIQQLPKEMFKLREGTCMRHALARIPASSCVLRVGGWVEVGWVEVGWMWAG